MYLLVSIVKISLQTNNLSQVQSSVPPTIVIFIVGFFFASVNLNFFALGTNVALFLSYLMGNLILRIRLSHNAI